MKMNGLEKNEMTGSLRFPPFLGGIKNKLLREMRGMSVPFHSLLIYFQTRE